MENLAQNLRRLRLEHRLSQAELARRAGLSRAGYRRLEQGTGEARASTVEALAAALDVPLGELLRPVPELHAVRFRAEGKLRTREEILTRVASWLSDYAELEELLGVKQTFALGRLARDQVGDPADVARAVRKELDLGPGELVRDVCGLLEDHGVKLATLQVLSKGFFGLSVADERVGPAVVVNTWSRITVERWIFTAAHELGHLLLHAPEFRVDQREENQTHEDEADAFAAEFLMPAETFEREWKQARGLDLVDRVFKLKRMFRVSWRTVLHGARGLDGPDVWGRFHAAFERREGKSLCRTDEPRPLARDEFRSPRPVSAPALEPQPLAPADFAHDRMHRLVRDAAIGGHITLSRAGEILGRSTDEMRALSASWAT